MSLPFSYQHSCIAGDALAVSTCRKQVVGGGGWPGTQQLISNSINDSKCFKSERGAIRRGKERKIPLHSINKPRRCSVGV